MTEESLFGENRGGREWLTSDFCFLIAKQFWRERGQRDRGRISEKKKKGRWDCPNISPQERGGNHVLDLPTEEKGRQSFGGKGRNLQTKKRRTGGKSKKRGGGGAKRKKPRLG